MVNGPQNTMFVVLTLGLVMTHSKWFLLWLLYHRTLFLETLLHVPSLSSCMPNLPCPPLPPPSPHCYRPNALSPCTKPRAEKQWESGRLFTGRLWYLEGSFGDYWQILLFGAWKSERNWEGGLNLLGNKQIFQHCTWQRFAPSLRGKAPLLYCTCMYLNEIAI